MTTLSGQKFPVVRIIVSVSNRGHLTGRALVKMFRQLLLNSVLIIHKRSTVIDGWYIACDMMFEFTYTDVSIIMVISYTAECKVPGPRTTFKNTSYCFNMLSAAYHPMVGATFWCCRSKALLA